MLALVSALLMTPPVLPAPPGPFHPARTRVSTPDFALVETAVCAECHPKQAAEWRTSAHALSSFDNPLYRSAVERFRTARGREASRMCGGCHDPALLVEDAMDAPVSPTDPRARAGVGCGVCHGITEPTTEGNGSYTLSPIPLPTAGDPKSIAIHKQAAGRVRERTNVLCGSCHKSDLSHEVGHPHRLAGMDDLSAWRHSPFGGAHSTRLDDPIEPKGCVDCHMRVEGRISHRFPGGHTWLAAAASDDAQLKAIQDLLTTSARLSVRPAPEPGAWDVVVRNVGVGHAFPGGTRDAQDTWVEVGRAGAEHERTGDDPGAWVLHTLVADADGVPVRPRQVERFYVPVADQTVPARDARLARYRTDAPRITARLRHRTRPLILFREACDAQKAQPEWRDPRIDWCTPPPVTDLAVAHPTDTKEAIWDHALALLHDLPERQTRPAPGLDRLRGRHWAARRLELEARRALKRGRWQEALDLAPRLQAVAPTHDKYPVPLLQSDDIRAAALLGQWRWSDAVAPAMRVARADGTTRALLRAATALAASDRPNGARRMAQRGMRGAPRHAELLRIQASALDSPTATKTWLLARGADDANAVRFRCAAEHPRCAAERAPVRHFDLTRQTE